MHAAIQATIFSEHEVFGNCCHFTLSIFLQKNVKQIKKIMSFNYKIYNLYNFLVSNTMNILI